MAEGILQFLTILIAVAIFVILSHARHEDFARTSKGWRHISLGFVCLLSGKISNFVLLILVQQGQMSPAATEPYAVAGLTAGVLGLGFLAIGLHRWFSAVKTVSAEAVAVKGRNGDLRERVSRHGKVLSMIPAALYRATGTLSGKNTKIVFLNDKIETLLGYGTAEFEADPLLFYKLMHDEDKKRYDEIERNESWHKESIVAEHRFRHRDGEYRWIRRHITRVGCAYGDLAEWHGCAFDITDLKRAEARLTNFLEAAPDPVVTANDQGEIVLVNAQAERLFGYSKTELLGRQVEILIPEEGHIRSSRELPDYPVEETRSATGVRFDPYGQHKNGTRFPVEISVCPFESENERLWAFSVRNISARKDIEAQLRQSQKMEAVGQLTGGIAHDFNNMLTVVIGNLQLLEEFSRSDDVACSATQAAMDASMRAAELTRRLLAFSRQQLLAPKTTNINELVNGIAPLLRRTISEDVTLNTKLEDAPWFARIDRSQLENTLVNLAINARDALHSGGGLTIETHNAILDETYAAQNTEVTPGEYVMVAVSDNGKGIPKDILPHVFEPFYSTKKVGKGSGLGLSMVYGFVKQSKGHIKIYSEEGHGTTIKIYLPRSKSTNESSAEHTSSTKAIPGGDETILLVEDDEAVRQVAIKLLTSLGYRVLHAESGSEALKLLAEHGDIDLLFTDIVMPGGMNGADLARCALDQYPNLKILYTSGYMDTTIIDAGLLEQCNDVLNKPYRKEELAQSVRDVLNRE